jgi:hypothetical protein
MPLTDGKTRMILLGTSLLAASYLLYLGAAMLLIVPGGTPYTFGERLAPTFFICIAVLMNFNAAYLLHLSQEKKFLHQLLFSFAITASGSVILSIIVWKGHWFAVVKSAF